MTIAQKLSTLALALCSCSTVTTHAQDSTKVVQSKRNRITFKPVDQQYQNLFFRDPMTYYGQYYGSGIEFERRMHTAGKWAYVLPLSIQKDFAGPFPSTAVMFYPGLRYYAVDRKVSYSVSFHVMLGHERVRDHFTESAYLGDNKYYWRNLWTMGMVHNRISFAISKSFRIGAECGIGLASVVFSQDYSKGGDGTKRDPWTVWAGLTPVQNYGLTLSYDF
ncbi:hypothetical protein [Edaphocola aurantiacus]|uniref:hypothetical protein n=1 Tax=Edaphocola aurantiacus TaxID=2601682 RepID=UPI001C942C5E|nr:hypothetical protein [Edaphocola aurantiacus]